MVLLEVNSDPPTKGKPGSGTRGCRYHNPFILYRTHTLFHCDGRFVVMKRVVKSSVQVLGRFGVKAAHAHPSVVSHC